MRLFKFFICSILLLLVVNATAADELLDKVKVHSITINIHPIFSEQEATGWIYQTANELHISTKPYVIKRLLPFAESDLIDQRAIDEAERILRQQAFLRDAQIEWLEGADGLEITVNTWENWTLLPTVDVSREGGETEYRYGIRDSNLLGRGIGATIEYFKEAERTGYTLSLDSQLTTENHIRGKLVLSDNSDGEQYAVRINKPFYTLDDRWMADLDLNSQRQIDTIYSNDEIINEFEHDVEHIEVAYGFSKGLVNGDVVRYSAGLTKRDDTFLNEINTIALPVDRKLLYPWAAVSYQEDRFIKTRNLYLIGRTEDIQLGWHHYLRWGINTDGDTYRNSWLWSAGSRLMQQYNNEHFGHFSIASNGIQGDRELPTSHYYNIGYEHFYHASDTRIWYLQAQYWGAHNPYIDKPISIGGEQGLRGYPLQYQHGEKAFLVNLEKRYYPGMNLFKLADVGFAAFVDIGKATGESLYPNQETGLLASVGIGLRFFLSRSSGRNVVNVDFATPINSDYLSGLDVSVTIKTRF
ncbi:MAG: hypothetical protein HWD86_10200 [Kangiellaceae bacterium]|nr:hypothetical protein [Kangiellaceae bacterium]